MANILLKVEETVLPNLAKAIMAKTGRSEPMALPEFETEVESITSSKVNILQEKTVTENGTYTADEGYDAIGKIIVNVPVLSDTDTSQYTMFFTENLGLVINGKVISAGDESATITPNAMSFTESSFGVEIQLYSSACYEVTSGASLAASVGCKTGDLVIAAIATRDTLTLSDGWTLISTSEVNSNDTSGNGQRLSFAYKYAESNSESITVTQATAQRLYINMISLQGATGFVDNGYHYVNTSQDATGNNASITVPKVEGPVLFACTAPLWSTTSPYTLWTASNDSKIIQLGTSTQSRLVVALDQSNDSEVTFTTAANNTTIIAGSLSIQGMESFSKIDNY